jgi:hypothetical protein
VESILVVLQKIYGTIFVIVLLAVIAVLTLNGVSRYSPTKWACIGLGLAVFAFSYRGLRGRKPWVLPLIVFSSALAIIPCVTDRPTTLIGVALNISVVAFSLYQLWFFTRPATRDFFKAGNLPVF